MWEGHVLGSCMDIQASYLENVLGSNQEAKFAIREIPHFRDCSDDLLKLVFTYGRIFSLEVGECLTREGEFDQWVYFLLGGKLAVLVGGEQVDTISSSMVGERCIFGQARKATLNADEGGIRALGIDMAILDTLQGGNGESAENVRVYSELLSIITEEIIDRVAELAYIQLDVGSKLAVNIQSDEVADIISGLIANSYSGDPQANIAIYKFLMKRDRALLALSLQPDKITVDTTRFYAHCVNSGRLEWALDLAHILYDLQHGAHAGGGSASGFMGRRNFYRFVHDVFEQVAERCRKTQAERGNTREITETGWREYFRMGPDLHISLAPVCQWLQNAYGFTDLQVVDILVMILQQASAYTAEINKTNKEMMVELSQIKGLKKLEAITENPGIVNSVFFDTRPTEEMIPLFSRHVLEVHLINPYLERIGKPAAASPAASPEAGDASQVTAAEDAPPAAEEKGGSRDVLDSLFD